MVHFLLQLKRDSPVIFGLLVIVGRMKFASLQVNLGGGWGILVYPILFPLGGDPT